MVEVCRAARMNWGRRECQGPGEQGKVGERVPMGKRRDWEQSGLEDGARDLKGEAG